MIRDFIRDLVAPRARIGAYLEPGVTLYGDSIMAGHCPPKKSNGSNYPNTVIAERLRELLPETLTVADRSVPGDTAENAWRRFPYELRSTRTVVLQLGTNDLSAGNDPLPALRKMAEYAIAEGRRVVFTGLTRRSDRITAPVDGEIARLAARLGARNAAWRFVPLDAEDGLHPSAAMADALANQLASVLEVA